MKKLKTIFATLVAVLSLVAFSSCNNDDEPATPAAKSIEGTYHGDMTCSVMGSESVFEDMTFTVKAVTDATVTIEISSFGEAPMQVPAITVEGVKVSGTEGTYALAETEFGGDLANGKTYSGTLDGTFADNKLSVRFNLNYGAMPMPMICSFTAPKN